MSLTGIGQLEESGLQLQSSFHSTEDRTLQAVRPIRTILLLRHDTSATTTGYNRSPTLSPRLDLPGFWHGTETKREVSLLRTWFGIAPVNKLVFLTWLLWALRSFRRFTLHYIANPPNSFSGSLPCSLGMENSKRAVRDDKCSTIRFLKDSAIISARLLSVGRPAGGWYQITEHYYRPNNSHPSRRRLPMLLTSVSPHWSCLVVAIIIWHLSLHCQAHKTLIKISDKI